MLPLTATEEDDGVNKFWERKREGRIEVMTTMESKNNAIGIGIENPFTLKVGQVFTGFGIGCGVGIGVGRPLNLGILSFSSKFTHIMDFKSFFKPKTDQNAPTHTSLHKPCITFFLLSLKIIDWLILIEQHYWNYIILVKLLCYDIFVGAIPMLNQVMSATRGATDAFSGVSRHVNTSVRQLSQLCFSCFVPFFY